MIAAWCQLARPSNTGRSLWVDPILAELAAAKGVTTPAIDKLVALIHDIEDGRRTQSMETFGELLAVCT